MCREDVSTFVQDPLLDLSGELALELCSSQRWNVNCPQYTELSRSIQWAKSLNDVRTPIEGV